MDLRLSGKRVLPIIEVFPQWGKVTFNSDSNLYPFIGALGIQFFVGTSKRNPRSRRTVPDPILILPAACYLPSSQVPIPRQKKPKIIRNMIVIKAKIKKTL